MTSDKDTTDELVAPPRRMGIRLRAAQFANVILLSTLVTGVVGLIYQSNQTVVEMRLDRELSYDQMWTDYIDLGIEYPLLVGGLDEDGYNALNQEEKTRYAWIFDRLVYTAESILSLDHEPDDAKAWRDVFETEIRKHSALIENDPNIIPIYFCQNDGAVRELISLASDKAAAQSGNCP